ncbi:unnamed protein product [Toxocara canis]|uniref:Caskin-1 n=1 Tax=Toxocara canis TaxID=6265 RepID=A0A183UHX2_TOXCA|nr:unnamed protein product [Toxocara canis]
MCSCITVCSMRQSGAPQSGCMGASSVAHPSTSHGQLRTLYVDQGGDDLSGECHRNSTGSNSSRGSSSGFESMKSGSSRGGSSGAAASASSSSSSFLAASTSSSAQVVASGSGLMRGDSPQSRVSVHSSSSGGTSSIASTSVDALDDPTCAHFYQSQLLTDSNAVCVPEMVLKGIPEAEILALWLEKLGHSEYLSVFLTQGYDLATIARITPEDLIALGITQPAHRKRIIAEIHTWHITDSWPLAVPSGNLREWLSLIGLPEYVELFESQGYYSMNEVQKLTWEDFEDVGIKKLGHLKRLGLAIKKMKDFRLGRVSSAAGGARMISVAPHNVRQSAQVKCMQPVLYDHHAPPPPAPTPSFHSNSRSSSGHYATWARYPRSFHAANDVDTPIHKPTVQVYPHHRSPVPSEEVDEYSCAQAMGKGKSGAVHGTDAESKFVRLNLYSSARILSEEAYPGSLSSRHPAMSASSLLGNVVDTTGTSDSEDYPPPPAPLACEGSIRLLRSAFRDSPASVGGGGVELQLRSTSGSGGADSTASSTEQLPFANENCGTIRSREPTATTTAQPNNSSSLSQPCTPRRSIHNVFSDDTDITKFYAVAGNGDVLNDIGYMLQNLTDELDAMLLPSQAVRTAAPAQQLAISQAIRGAESSS